MGWLRKAGLHYVAIDYTRTDGETARVLLQADKKNYVQMLTALSASTGVRVSMPQADRKHFRKEFAAQELNQPLRRVPGIAAWRVEPLTGHRKGVTSIAFSADGRLLASGSDDGTVLVWDVASRKIMWSSPRQGRAATGIAFGPGGKLLASWNIFKSNVTVWDVGTNTIVADIDGHDLPGFEMPRSARTGRRWQLEDHSYAHSEVVRLWRLNDRQTLGEFRAEQGRGSLSSAPTARRCCTGVGADRCTRGILPTGVEPRLRARQRSTSHWIPARNGWRRARKTGRSNYSTSGREGRRARRSPGTLATFMRPASARMHARSHRSRRDTRWYGMSRRMPRLANALGEPPVRVRTLRSVLMAGSPR